MQLRNRLGTDAAPGGSFRVVHFGNFQRKSGRNSKILCFKFFGFTFAFADTGDQKSYSHGNAPHGRRIAPVAARAASGQPPGMSAGGAAALGRHFN